MLFELEQTVFLVPLRQQLGGQRMHSVAAPPATHVGALDQQANLGDQLAEVALEPAPPPRGAKCEAVQGTGGYAFKRGTRGDFRAWTSIVIPFANHAAKTVSKRRSSRTK
jgi:hypothetical protein